MPDEMDYSSELQQEFERRKLEEVREQANKLEVEATGKCLWCEEPLEKPLRWCDAYCRDQWEMYGS